MAEKVSISTDARLRLDTLVAIRWLAVGGQTVAVAVVAFFLDYDFPLSLCLALIAVSAWLNVFLRFRYKASFLLPDGPAMFLLAYDILQLSALLYLTGGLQNPFSVLLIVPVIVSAASQTPRQIVPLGLLTTAAASALAFFHLPLPWEEGETLSLPFPYVAGMWVAIVSSLVFTAVYAFRVASEARKLSDALAATELVLQREQHLSTLDGLAAAAAHELGTPLATITLVTKELEHGAGAYPEIRDDITLLRAQAERCRDILRKLTRSPAERDPHHSSLPVTQLLQEAAAPYRMSMVTVEIAARPSEAMLSAAAREPVGERRPAIAYGLGNLLENAVDFAEARVEVDARWTAAQVSITVRDDGPGFHENIFDRLGDPFVTSRPGYGEETGEPGRHEGMGLGFFIAKTLLERTGATVSLANRPTPEHGAVVHVVWPRGVIDLGRA